MDVDLRRLLSVQTDGTWWGTALKSDGEFVEAMKCELVIEVDQVTTAEVTYADGSQEMFEVWPEEVR